MFNPEDQQQTLNEIYKLLLSLGISAKYRGYYHAAYSVLLCVQQPERIYFITKYVYPAVAQHYHTNWRSVERNIRSINALCWANHAELLCALCHCQLTHPPTNKEFIAILASHFSIDNAA